MKKLLIAASALVGVLSANLASAQDTIKVGVLHSLSGTMAISETSLRDVLLFTFDEINAAGGVMGKKIEPVVVDDLLEDGRDGLRDHGIEHPRLVEVADDDRGGVAARVGKGGLGLLVVVLAVDHRGVAIPGVLLDPLPDVQYRAAGGIVENAVDGPEPVEVLTGHPEGRNQDHVIGGDPGAVGPAARSYNWPTLCLALNDVHIEPAARLAWF